MVGYQVAFDVSAVPEPTGVAMMLELARVFQRNSSDLKRELRIAFWTGHETGIMSGSTWYVDNFWTELRERCLCYVNCDSPGLAEATIFGSSDTEELSDFTVKTAKDAVGEDFPIESYQRRRPVIAASSGSGFLAPMGGCDSRRRRSLSGMAPSLVGGTTHVSTRLTK